MTSQLGTEGSVSVRPLTVSEEDFQSVWILWSELFPEWPIEEALLRTILGHPFLARQGRHFISTTTTTTTTSSNETTPTGFILTYLGDGGEGKKGFVSVVGVLPQYRGRGVGGKLLERGVGALRGAAGEGKEEGREIEIVIGSETPRFWPGLPVEFGENVKAWFGKRGMLISTF